MSPELSQRLSISLSGLTIALLSFRAGSKFNRWLDLTIAKKQVLASAEYHCYQAAQE